MKLSVLRLKELRSLRACKVHNTCLVLELQTLGAYMHACVYTPVVCRVGRKNPGFETCCNLFV